MIARKGFTGGEIILPVSRQKRYYDAVTKKRISKEKANELVKEGKRKAGKKVETTTTWFVSPIWILITLFSALLYFAAN
ncbi:MAG: hypothetical protein KKF50_00655 [Nanoarchaeota archaeon]|nr:hypothetical protein [Nanoarchaeota archaeon]